jgi:hypothetical protein
VQRCCRAGEAYRALRVAARRGNSREARDGDANPSPTVHFSIQRQAFAKACACLAKVTRRERDLTQPIQDRRDGRPFPQSSKRDQCFLVEWPSCRSVPSHARHRGEAVAGPCLTEPVAELAAQRAS